MELAVLICAMVAVALLVWVLTGWIEMQRQRRRR